MAYVTFADLGSGPECQTGHTGGVCNDANPGLTRMLPRHLKNLLGIGKPRCIACGAQDVPLVKGCGRSVGLFCAMCAASGWVPSQPRPA